MQMCEIENAGFHYRKKILDGIIIIHVDDMLFESKRVARSTLTAETLVAIEAVDLALVLKRNIEEILKIELRSIHLMVDNKSLYDAVRTYNTLSEKRLIIDMFADK